MGVYVYTLRRRTVNVTLPDGGREAANFCSFAFKPYFTLFAPADAARREARYLAAGRRAFEQYAGGLVVVGDCHESLDELNGAYAYRAMRSSNWVDTVDFPATPAGIITVRDGVASLSDFGPWSDFTVNGVTMKRRPILRNGVFTTETELQAKQVPINGTFTLEGETFRRVRPSFFLPYPRNAGPLCVNSEHIFAVNDAGRLIAVHPDNHVGGGF